MTLREYDTPVGGPDGSFAIVGDDGEILQQSRGRQVIRQGAPGEDANWSLDGHDLTLDPYIADPQDVGGTSIIIVDIESVSDSPFDVTFKSLTEDGDTIREVTPDRFSGHTEINRGKYDTTADYMEIVVSDATDDPGENHENIVTGTINIHAGGSPTVQLEDSAGEITDFAREETLEAVVDGVQGVSGDMSPRDASATLTDGSRYIVESGGRPTLVLQWKNVEETGTIEVETSGDGEEWWPAGDVEVEDPEADFAQLPWTGDEYVRITSDGLEADVRAVTSR